MTGFEKAPIGWIIAMALALALVVAFLGCSQQPVYVGVSDNSLAAYVAPAVDSTLWQIHEENQDRELLYRNIDTGNANMLRSADQMNRNFYETDHALTGRP